MTTAFIDIYKNIVIQIATPYNTGTGFCVPQYGLIVTNEHVVRENSEVVVSGAAFPKQMAKVVFLDAYQDLAFLRLPEDADLPLEQLQLGLDKELVEGDTVVAVGHPFGLKYAATKGIVSNTRHLQNDIHYIQHDAALNPGNSGGPLLDEHGRVVGVNTFIVRDGVNIGFSLPVRYLKRTLLEFMQHAKGGEGLRCFSCANLIFAHNIEQNYCPHCGARADLPSEAQHYEPVGVARTIENLIIQTGIDVRLARRGSNCWLIQRGSAKVLLTYHEQTGSIVGDAALCLLPKQGIKDIYYFILKENYTLESLSLSVLGQDVMLSLVIYDRYFDEQTGNIHLKRLFDKADYYDDIFIEKYGALPKPDEDWI